MCYACEEREARLLAEPFQFYSRPPCEEAQAEAEHRAMRPWSEGFRMLPHPAEDADPDDVVTEGALERYLAGLLQMDEARRLFMNEVRQADLTEAETVIKVILARDYRTAHRYARDHGWQSGRTRMVYLTGDMEPERVLRGVRRVEVYRVDGFVSTTRTEAYLRRVEAREMTPGGPERVQEGPGTSGEVPDTQTYSRAIREALERSGYTGMVWPDGSAVLMGTSGDLQFQDEGVEMTVERLQEWIERMNLLNRPEPRRTISWVPNLQDPAAPTQEELDNAVPMGEAVSQEITFYRDEYPRLRDRMAVTPVFIRPGEVLTYPAGNQESIPRPSHQPGQPVTTRPESSSGMPFMWASRLERHPGWNAKDRTLSVFASPYAGDERLTYREDELEENVRWF